MIKGNVIDRFISKSAKYWLRAYDFLYGPKYFGWRQWAVSGTIVFCYCVLFAYVEERIGFESTVTKQLRFWFVPSLLADVLSVNATRVILNRIALRPREYIVYSLYDIALFMVFYYLSFVVAIHKLYSDYSHVLSQKRIILHPYYMAGIAILDRPEGPMGLDIVLTVCMALTTAIPTILHLLFVGSAVLCKILVPFLTLLSNHLIERIIKFDHHPLAVAIMVVGLACLPLVALAQLLY